MEQQNSNGWFGVSAQEIRTLFTGKRNPAIWTRVLLWLVTLFLTPITLIGALFGFGRSYLKFQYPRNIEPKLHPLIPIMRVAMVIGAIGIWVVLFIVFWLVAKFVPDDWIESGFILYYFGVNFLIGIFVFFVFWRWQSSIKNMLDIGSQFGTARFARSDELEEYIGKQGFYIGGGYTFNDKGHMLTVAGTRGGKGTNLIIPNLLGVGNYNGSWVVIDPKGENAAITARYQRERGQNVVILNPWDLLGKHTGEAQSYNPLDILYDLTNVNMVDDVQMIAEMIVPINKQDNDKFFTDNARAIVAGLILFLVVERDKEERILKTIWEWLRLPKDQWANLLEEMKICDHDLFGNVINQAANEIMKLMAAGDRTWGTIIAVALQCTDFIKSPALQKSMQSGFAPETLSDGKTSLYIIIPADKLQSHARWLRLVVTTTMRAVVRNPKNRVCFLLDEFAALGYLPEIETALSTYAGYNITVWSILQTLIQLKSNYHDNWETFVGNSTIRQYFSVNDNFTADYVSTAIGMTSNITRQLKNNKEGDPSANQRQLVTPDELRRGSGQNIFTFIADKPITHYPKWPYYQMPDLIENGEPRFDENPYY